MAKQKAIKQFDISPQLKAEMIDFLAFYKTISIIKTDKELTRRYPKIKEEVLSLFPRSDLITKTNSELKSYDLSSVGNDCVIYSKKHTKTLCFLRHIRNAIAHWNITTIHASEKYFLIQDFNRSKDITAYGRIRFNTFRRILQIIKNK